ncbi:DUF924 domain-containing protein [Pseudomonas stutzeri]|uniref:DUF924 domain-containing protein n=1 Tax=Stutzerimonas stutzeri (strain ATCC 17588 / DSM 5190 / CCUG 11256 / JCM 5965 / LMG 11199 / NBRC 14165 / NCIMB 11358 / Stanier 221) TaxID=96563 RepID=F8H6X2_STUS2|nr:DUF924 family protein [Stutzerimonas stutzeri]AEJ03637.1 hypothetical protein PSTAB_0356 [Stutzerimonas stutzeri]MCQ4229521.1 DUF924 domain-containing protein [Stutzerimonas stutzeri]MCQ4237120.1 DUF924 domain-containing protein [Stutzerimonas stutzeri]MDH1669937.1 DUF924 domain-containing protein [Stutzerimonas stutzeri]QPT28728.1 DUF924 domain-containing protein [Stutzerimonas stutzeri]
MQAPWQDLLHWWFGQGTSATEIAAEKQRLWFGYRPQQDAEARERFGALVEQALNGDLQDWAEQPEGWLALVLLLDQLPRMIHRDTPRAFAGDERAQQLVRDGLAHGGDMLLSPIQRVFIYLVLEHAENLAVQDLAVAHFTALRDIAAEHEQALFRDFLDYAERHREVISRFGRFPHRNAILGRDSSDAEQSFLQQPGSSF